MPPLPNPNEKAAAVTSCDGLDFVWTTNTLTQEQANDPLHIYHSADARN